MVSGSVEIRVGVSIGVSVGFSGVGVPVGISMEIFGVGVSVGISVGFLWRGSFSWRPRRASPQSAVESLWVQKKYLLEQAKISVGTEIMSVGTVSAGMVGVAVGREDPSSGNSVSVGCRVAVGDGSISGPTSKVGVTVGFTSVVAIEVAEETVSLPMV